MSLPVVGREYDYLDTIVEVIDVIPCKGGTDDDATVRFVNRFCQYGSCDASELTERKPPASRLPAALIVLAMIFCASSASACERCGLFGSRCVLRQNVVVQPVAVQQYAYPQQISYFVGAPIRVEAIVQKSLQENPEYAEFQRFRAWKQELERKPTVGEPLNKPTETIPQSIPTSLLVARCSQCHSGDNPKGGLLLDGTAELTCDQALRAMKMVQAGKMPPKNKLTPEDAGGVFQDLLDLVKTK